MNIDPDDLRYKMQRIVPADLLKDKSFSKMVKTAVKESAPSESESLGNVVRQKKRRGGVSDEAKRQLFDAANNPARLLDRNDPGLLPDIERRAYDRFGQGGDPAQAPFDWQDRILAFIQHPKGIVLGVALAVCMYVYVTEREIVQKLGFSYGAAATFPFLAGLFGLFAGVPSEQMLREIGEFRLGMHILQRPPIPEQRAPSPTMSPPPSEPEVDPAQERKDTIMTLIDEALYTAMVERGEIDKDAPPAEETPDVEKESEPVAAGEDIDETSDERVLRRRRPRVAKTHARAPRESEMVLSRIEEVSESSEAAALDPDADIVRDTHSLKIVEEEEEETNRLPESHAERAREMMKDEDQLMERTPGVRKKPSSASSSES